MKNNTLAFISPGFLKQIDSLLGRLLARLLPLPHKTSSLPVISSILLIRPGGIGDAALTAPLITALSTVYPEADIDILAEQRNSEVFPLIPEINKLYLYNRPVDLFNVLRSNYDLVIDTEQWHRLSAVITRLTGAACTIGYATNERSRLFTNPVNYSHDQYEAQSFLNLLQPLGIHLHFNPELKFLIIPDTRLTESTDLPGRQSARFIALFPGASITARQWGTGKFRKLAARFIETGFTPLVVGGVTEKASGDEITAGGGLNYAGRTTIAGTARLLASSDLLVSGDSGLLHIAAGLDLPTVSLFGPGIAAKWAPRGERHVVINKNIDCSPCTKFGYTPPCPEQAYCMADISVDDVYSAATALLNKVEFNAKIANPNAGQGE